MALLRYTFELYLGATLGWVDITALVRHQKVNIERGTKDESPKLTPAKAKLTLENKDDRFNPRNPTGPYFGQLVRNTPIRIRCSGGGFGISDPERFYGEVFAFEPRWNEDRSNCTVPIEANGALRRILGNDVQPRSYYRSWVNTHTLNPIPKYYWALEEGSGAGTGQPDIGQGSAVMELADPRFPVPNNGNVFGAAKFNDWIPNGAALPNLWQFRFPCDMRGSTSPAWEVTCLLTFPTNETTCVIVIYTEVGFWHLTLYNTFPDWEEGNVVLLDPNGGVASSTGPIGNLRDVGPVWVTFRASFSGSVISNYVTIAPINDSAATASVLGMGSFARSAHMYPRELTIAVSNNTASPTTNIQNYLGVKDVSVSEASSGSTGMSLSYAATKGAPGESTHVRFARMCDEQGINWTASSLDAVAMGRQYVQAFEDHLLEILASSEHAAIVESKTDNELLLLGTGTHRGTIDYSEIVPDLEPTEDDKNTANIVRLNNSHSGQATLTKPTGEMSIAHIGPFEKKLETNNRTFAQAVALAGKLLALGTWAGPRFTEITVSARSTPVRYGFYRSIEVGDFFSLDLSDAGYHDLLIVKVMGIRDEISHEDHRFTFTVRPGELDYRLWTVGTNRVDIADSTVAVASSGSTLDVNVPTAKWANSSAPFDIMVSGERMTVTAVANLTSTTQRLTVTRSVNGVVKTAPLGAEVHLYPAFFIKAV